MLEIDDMMFASLTYGPAGQIVITAEGSTAVSVPPGVTNVCILCVEPGNSYDASGTTASVGGALVCRALNGSRTGQGGGEGGSSNSSGGGGGAGGYSGNGGDGGGRYSTGGENFDGYAGSAGNGGAGGGGGGGSHYVGFGGVGSYATDGAPGPGGAVGLNGQGGSGAAGAGGATGSTGGSGAPGSGGAADASYGTDYGAAYPVNFSPAQGGSLSYKNNVPVSPGGTVDVYIPPRARNGYGQFIGGPGAVRILFGTGRTFPNNAGDS